MIFKLALALGMTVRQLLNNLDSHELTEWIAYDMIEPIGPWRDDLRAGVIASTIANIFRAKHQHPLRPTDFIPEFNANVELSPEETIQIFAAAFGADHPNRSYNRS